MRRLKDNISSDYVNAANRLNGRNARKRIVAYVEAYDDIFFWRTVLSEFENDRIYFEVMLPSRQNLTKGKKSALMSLLNSKVGDSMIACVDADYDYLLQGTTAVSKQINENPYIFHTYVYAIENYQCYAPSLHDVSVAVALNDHIIFDFEDYLRQYSETIFPLFVWNIWFYRRNSYGKFTINDFIFNDNGTKRPTAPKRPSTGKKKSKKKKDSGMSAWGCLGRTIVFTLILFAAYVFFGLLLETLQ